jgi:predicted nucleic acid-binding protein
MTVLVDTTVWSLMLRRRQGSPSAEARELEQLIREGEAGIIGPVRQELLSGVKGARQFEKLRQHLRAFPDEELQTADYELAAQFFNRCRRRGIQGSNTDFLLCSVAARRQQSIFTTDRDFAAYGAMIPLQLHVIRP